MMGAAPNRSKTADTPAVIRMETAPNPTEPKLSIINGDLVAARDTMQDYSEYVDVDDLRAGNGVITSKGDAFASSLTMMEEAPSNNLSTTNGGEPVPHDEDDDDSQAMGGGSESGLSSVHVESQQKRLRKETAKNLAAKENKAVLMLRILVFGLLLTVTAVVLVGVYTFASQAEQQDFKDGFRIHAGQLTESFRNAVERKLVSVGTMGNTITSYAQATGAEFPYVTIPDFAVRASDIRVLADAVQMVWCPLVTDDTRLRWEEYAFMHRFQINKDFKQDNTLRAEQDDYFDSLVFGSKNNTVKEQKRNNNPDRKLQQQGQKPEQKPEEENPNILNDGTNYHLQIFDPSTDGAVPNGTGPYLPGFQRSPVNFRVQNAINADYAHAKVFTGVDILGHLLNSSKVVINKMTPINPKYIKPMTANLKISQYRNRIDTYLMDPLSFLAYPVFTSFNSTTRTLAGAIICNLYWRVYFQDVLPSNAQGIIAVVTNSYNQTFSYLIDGSNTTLLGPGDFHDDKYSDMAVTLDVTNYVKERSSPETRAYLTVPLHETLGRYVLTVYPTDSTKDAYVSSKPILYTTVVGAIFAVTALVFILFDTWVERRQKIVLKRAVESGAIVNELFPEQVQERLYQDDNNGSNDNAARGSWKVNPDQAHGLAGVSARENKSGMPSSGGQIADEYKNCTVIFTDLAGFTAWSSSRSPCEVFELLETIYNAIDTIALRRKVFKVETIGDCWLGVCGLPHPNPKHALVMARFADDCQKKMQELVVSLSMRLGADTETLRLRTGLHSGTVTAGVLRGQKSRFQLFGDTVNTASRIETTGMPGRIHASQTTADELIAVGKKAWLKPRTETIVAKGKGEMKTYWIELGLDTKSCHTSHIETSESSHASPVPKTTT